MTFLKTKAVSIATMEKIYFINFKKILNQKFGVSYFTANILKPFGLSKRNMHFFNYFPYWN